MRLRRWLHPREHLFSDMLAHIAELEKQKAAINPNANPADVAFVTDHIERQISCAKALYIKLRAKR